MAKPDLRNVIQLQRQRFPDLNWVVADLRRMPRFKDKSFDIVIEKALKLELVMLGGLELDLNIAT